MLGEMVCEVWIENDDQEKGGGEKTKIRKKGGNKDKEKREGDRIELRRKGKELKLKLGEEGRRQNRDQEKGKGDRIEIRRKGKELEQRLGEDGRRQNRNYSETLNPIPAGVLENQDTLGGGQFDPPL